MKFYTQEEIENEFIGEKGTIEMFLIGEVIKRTRFEKNLT